MSTARRTGFAAVAWLAGLGLLRATFWAPEVCPGLPLAEAEAAIVAAGDWIVETAPPDGRYRYELDRRTGEAIPGYNLVRHAGVTMSLYQLAGGGFEQYLEPADVGLAWMLDRLVPAGDGAVAFTDGPDPKLGAAALLTVSLAQRRLVTGDTVHDDTMRALGRFMAGQQRADGSMLDRWDLDTRAPIPDQTSIFATGEANWAFALLHEAFPDEGWDERAWSTLDHLALRRDAVEGIIPQPWPDQWAAYTLAEMAEWNLADRHVDYARRMAERFAFLVRFDAQRGSPVGGLTHGPSPRGGGIGTWIEGLASLATLADTEPRFAAHGPAIDEALACGTANLVDDQVRSPDPQLDGAWFYDGRTRMDDQQHAASGILLSLAHRDGDR